MRTERILNYLKTNSAQADIFIYPTLDSTNNEAKRILKEKSIKGFIIADEQTNGRGRQGHKFFSPKGAGLYFTVVLYPKINLFDAAKITIAAALSVTDALEKHGIADAEIKWVNDIYIGGKKACGILAESVTDINGDLAIIIGIGINTVASEFPEEIKNTAASIGEVDTDILAADIYLNLKRLSESLNDHGIIKRYEEKCFVIGKDITFTRNGKFYEAKALSITESGALKVLTREGEEMLLESGEISIKING